MATRRQLRFDVINRIRPDGRTVTLIERHIDFVLDQQRAQLLYTMATKIGTWDSKSLYTIGCVPTKKEQRISACKNCGDQYALDLPFKPLSLPEDGGIVHVSSCGVVYGKIVGSRLNVTLGTPLLAPSVSRPKYSLQGGSIWLFAPGVDLSKCEFIVTLLPASTLGESGCGCGDDDEYPIDDALRETLIQNTIQALLPMESMAKDKTSDGVNNPQ